jgi:uncharacterized protein (TIGR02001 family)
MRKVTFATAIALAVVTTSAFAADLGVATKAPPPPPATPVFDIAVGGGVATDYNFRGISQSDRGPSVNAYFEPRWNFAPNWQLYAGVAGYSTKLPTDPTGEFDLYAGVRPTFGPLALDFGFIYYYYPNETQLFVGPGGTFLTTFPLPGSTIFTLADTDYWELYAKGVYTFNDNVAVGANLYYSPSWLNTGASGTFASGTLKLTAPSTWFQKDFGAYLSGEFGYYWLGTTDPILGSVNLPNYAFWNVGIGFTYKAMTLDLRYYDTDASKAECFLLTGDPGGFTTGTSNWCSAAFIAKVSFDTTLSALK